MKKTLTLIFIIAINFNLCKSQECSKVNFDFSGLESFVNLCKSQDINTNDIDSMIHLPAYQGMINWLTKNWWEGLNEDVFRNFFQAVFIPEKYTINEEYKKFSRISNHIVWAKENHLQIERYIKTMKPGFDSQKVIERTLPFLPNNIPKGEFNVYFVVGLTQGSASSDGVFIDSKYKIYPGDPDKYLIPWIAHELHHSWREMCVEDQSTKDSTLNGITQVLYWLESEGVAKMVGFSPKDLNAYIKKEEIKMKNGENVNYRIPIYLKSNKYLFDFNNAISKVLSGASDSPVNDVIKTLAPPNSAHAYHEVGHIMAYYIDKILGRNELVNCVGKPKEFLQAYQKCAIIIADPKKAYIFDKDVIKGIDYIEWQ